MITHKELVKKIQNDLNLQFTKPSLEKWIGKGYFNGVIKKDYWLNKLVKRFNIKDYEQIKERIIELIKQRKIRPKGWDKYEVRKFKLEWLLNRKRKYATKK